MGIVSYSRVLVVVLTSLPKKRNGKRPIGVYLISAACEILYRYIYFNSICNALAVYTIVLFVTGYTVSTLS